MTRPHYVNGRVLHRPSGGVKRYATEVIDRLDDAVVISPRSAEHAWSARVWEQTTLVHKSADGVLLSLANGGPVRHPRHVPVIHDLFALTDSGSVGRPFAAINRVQMPRLIRQAAQVVTVSRHVADQLMINFDLAVDRITVVPPGISDLFRRPGCPTDRANARSALGLADLITIAAVLDPTPRKNPKDVARLLDQICADFPQTQTVTAGQIQAAAFAGPRSGPVAPTGATRHLGPVDDATLALMYRSADIFVALSSGEGFGLPVVEAAASGAWVVSTPVPSLIEHAIGCAVFVDDAAGAYDAIRALIETPERRSKQSDPESAGLGDLRWTSTAATLGAVMETVGHR